MTHKVLHNKFIDVRTVYNEIHRTTVVDNITKKTFSLTRPISLGHWQKMWFLITSKLTVNKKWKYYPHSIIINVYLYILEILWTISGEIAYMYEQVNRNKLLHMKH